MRMKQKNLRVGKTVYIKNASHVSSWLVKGQAFTIKRIIQGAAGIKRYYDEKENMAGANELTEIPCKQKDCPCH